MAVFGIRGVGGFNIRGRGIVGGLVWFSGWVVGRRVLSSCSQMAQGLAGKNVLFFQETAT